VPCSLTLAPAYVKIEQVKVCERHLFRLPEAGQCSFCNGSTLVTKRLLSLNVQTGHSGRNVACSTALEKTVLDQM